jgi:hypothetical protein
MTTTPLDESGEDELLVLAGERAERIRADKTDLLRIAYRIGVIHNVDGLGPDRDLPGRERAKRLGGEGTPEVLEFAAAELAARTGVTTYRAEQQIGYAMDLHHRTPDLWAQVEAKEVDPDYACLVAKKTRGLGPEHAAWVAGQVARSAAGRVPWTRFEKQVDAAVAKADVEATREKEERAARSPYARKCRDEADGMAALLARGPSPAVDQMDATLESYGRAIAEDFPDLSPEELRFKALQLLLTPASDHDPRTALADHAPVVHLYVHVYAGSEAQPSEGIARLEDHGPVTEAWVEALGPHCRFKVQPVLDIAGMAPVDAYEIPDRHRQAVQILTPADTFPYGTNLTRNKQVDHTRPWKADGPPGQSGIGNYGPMTTPHHRIKTHGRWQVQQPFPGIYLWRDAFGATYLVDNNGTRTLPKPDVALPLVVEIYRDLPHTELDWAA